MPKFIAPELVHLSNEIPVVLQHYDSPVAATYWWVKTGSGDEKPAEAGFAHFLEHMLFKDAAAKETGKSSTGQTAQAIESLGGDINAYTSFDQTVYHVTCSAFHWEKVLDAFGPMAKPQKFLKSDFEREREVILEELRKNEDSPGRQLFQKLFSETFQQHPYGKPVIGTVKSLKSAKVQNLEAFYRRNYVSENMGIVIVGPLKEKAARDKILSRLEKYFGKKVLKKNSVHPVSRPSETAVKKSSRGAVLPFDVKTPTLSVSFRVPDLYHEDVPALDLLSSILGMGELSRLYQSLFYKHSVANEVSAGLYIPKDPGMLYFQAEVSTEDKIIPAANLLFSELRRICEEGPTEEELKRVIVNAESEKLYATQTADGLAGRVGFLKFILGDLDYDQRYLEEIRSLDAGTIQAVGKKYFDPKRMSAVVLLPKESKTPFDIQSILEIGEKTLYPTEITKPKKMHVGPELPVQFWQLPSGIRVVHLERPQSHAFSLHVSALGGLRLELAQPVGTAATDWGASHLLAATWNKGTKTRDARAISSITEGSAAAIDGFSGRNTIGLQMTGLHRDWAKLSELFTEVLLEPTFPNEEIGHARRVTEDTIRSIEDHSSQLCSKLFLESLFEHHPYGKITIGSMESIHGIDQKKLQAFHRAWVQPERLVISVTGAIKRSTLDFWLKDIESKVLAQAKTQKNAQFLKPAHIDDEPLLKAPRWSEKNLKREQVHILVGGLGARMKGEDRQTIRLLQNLLGGQSGRLFIELREKKSLAYTVAPTSFEGIEKGYIGTYIASSPEKREEALLGIKKVLETLAAKGPNRTEMKRAQEFYLGRRAMDLQSDSAWAGHLGLEYLYGLPYHGEKAIVKEIQAVTPEEIQRVCRKYLVDQPMVTSVVG